MTRLFTREEVRSLPRREIATRIEDALEFDEGEWQERTGIAFPGRKRAEHAERALFWCPACSSWGTLRSSDSTLRCVECGFSAWNAPSGRWYADPSAESDSVAVSRIFRAARLNELQLVALRAGIAREVAPTDRAGDSPLPYRVPRVAYLTGYRSRPLVDRGTPELALTSDSLTLTPGPRIPIGEISGINVQYATQLEFYARGELHVLRMQRPEDSAYRIEASVLALQDLYNYDKH